MKGLHTDMWCFTGTWEERRVGEKHTYYDFNLGFLWAPNQSNSYIILCITSALFPEFFPHRIWCGADSYSRPARHIQSTGTVSHPELSVCNSLELLLHVLVQAASQWRDDVPYCSGFFWPECKEWPLLCKFSESS